MQTFRHGTHCHARLTHLRDAHNEFFGGAGSLFLVKYYPVRTFGVTVTRSFR
jgi:hypothetical protein